MLDGHVTTRCQGLFPPHPQAREKALGTRLTKLTKFVWFWGTLPKIRDEERFAEIIKFIVIKQYTCTVRENASFGRSDHVTLLLFRLKIVTNKRKKIWALKKAWFSVPTFSIWEFQSLIIERSLSEGWELLAKWIDKIYIILEGPATILVAIECKYMLLCSFFTSLPNFFDIETHFPRNYNILVLYHQSFIGGNKLVTMATMHV